MTRQDVEIPATGYFRGERLKPRRCVLILLTVLPSVEAERLQIGLSHPCIYREKDV